ncbi:lipoate--protein ligase [Mesomycoplasma neurolyticum]|uniref:lipoate--protein ligase n=1 Tax=Mesomycoplasma neurolyticum TaxID=2120 RepID=A0A449A5W0_9BACT|nr:lipoate--protein ligase [Mesomycoplasma neurolyticum]VEU59626.1 Lipoate-protein ligase A [Mesomycoplasma neurolyticum]
MKIFVSKKYSPFFNLTIEEAIAKDEELQDDIIFFYQHDNAVIIGQNQNVHKEVKLDVLKNENIELYRRLSGGGAVYHDLGNLNFSFITKKDNSSYEKFLSPILEFLKSLNLDAKFKGRNDLVVNDAKFSGNAQFMHKNKIVHHGTILFNADLTKLSKVLNPSKLKMKSKGIESARQRVTNLLNEMHNKISFEEFFTKMLTFFKLKYNAEISDIPEKYLTKAEEFKKIRISDEWLYGKNPEFSFFNEAKTDGGILQISANIIKNKISEILFEGDFLSKKNLNEIRKRFVNVEYNKEVLTNLLNQIENLEDYFGNIKIEEIIRIMFGEESE